MEYPFKNDDVSNVNKLYLTETTTCSIRFRNACVCNTHRHECDGLDFDQLIVFNAFLREL